MKNLIVLIVFFVGSNGLLQGENAKHNKPAYNSSTTVSAMRLAEAKAILSKPNNRKQVSTLGIADGGI